MLLNFLKSCAYCSSPTKIRLELCHYCWDLLDLKGALKFKPNHNGMSFPLFYLYSWHQDRSPLLNCLLMVQKSKDVQGIIAERFSYERGFLEDVIFLPIPPSKPGEQDHAFRFASYLSVLYGAPVSTGLMWTQKRGESKHQTVVQRKLGGMEILSTELEKISKFQRVIVVDDIVTTGATATKAKEALRGIKRIELWTIACRESGPLI